MSNEAKLFEENNRLTARINLLEQTLATTKVENATLQEKHDGLLETVKLANQRKFSPSTEANILQQNLFDEVGVASSEPGEQNAKDKTGTTTYTVTRKKKNHPTRKPLLEHLPRVKTILEPTEADKMCSCANKWARKSQKSLSLNQPKY